MEPPEDTHADGKHGKESKAAVAKKKLAKGGKSVGKFFKQKVKQIKETTKAIAEYIDDEIHHRVCA